MIRTIVLVIAATAVGMIGGAFAVKQVLQPTDDRTPVPVEPASSTPTIEAVPQAKILEDENSKLRSELAQIKRQMEALAAAEKLETVEEDEFALEMEQAVDAATNSQPERAERRGRDRRQPDGDAVFTDEERQEREARRADFEQRGRDRRLEILQEEYDKAPDDYTRSTITSLNEQMDYMATLREQMRDVETDEERDALREDMRSAWQNTQQTIQNQQDKMLKDLAASNGITDPAKQAEFVSALRETQSSLFFQPGAIGGRGGPGGFGGGPGGFGGGFGGRGR